MALAFKKTILSFNFDTSGSKMFQDSRGNLAKNENISFMMRDDRYLVDSSWSSVEKEVPEDNSKASWKKCFWPNAGIHFSRILWSAFWKKKNAEFFWVESTCKN